MPGQVAPWLEDLDEDWALPAAFAHKLSLQPQDQDQDSSSNNNNDQNQNQAPASSQRSRIPRRSSGAYSHASEFTAASLRRRAPLGELSSSAGNVGTAGHEHFTASKLPLSRPGSLASASAGSVVRYDTAERKANGSSPNKEQHTLEWKKRLIDGELGYGDQTDLFGPSGLENIFQSPSRPTTANSAQPQQPFKKMFRQQDFPPSSPPPWPSTIDLSHASSPALQDSRHRPDLGQVQEEEPVSEFDEDYEHEEAKDKRKHEVNHRDYNDPPEESSMASVRGPDTSPYQLPGLGQFRADTRFLQPSSCKQPGNRTISGQTDYSGEAFSPVFISKHTTLDGRIDYAAVDPKDIESFQLDSQLSEQSISEDVSEQLPLHSEQRDEDGFGDSEMPSVPEVSLPENLPTGTPPIATLGDFVNVKRGGLSQQGSFKTRALSPSQSESLARSSNDETNDAHLDLDQSENRKSRPMSFPGSSDMERPVTPMTRHEPTLLSPSLSPPKTRPSPSPLKLFGTYDTFTNNRLLRRMSQLEDIDQAVADIASINANAPVEGQSGIPTQSPRPTPCASSQQSQRNIRPSLSSFGEGELDEHDFEADLSIPTGLQLRPDDSFEGSPPPEIVPPGSRTPFRFHLDESSDPVHSFKLKRKLSKRSTARSRVSGEYASVRQNLGADEVEESQQVEGKRPHNSPTKAPTPKRRRTIVALKGALPGLGHHSAIQVKITGASTDGSRSTSLEDGGSWGLTQDNQTRPRNPTPSQYREDQIHEEVGEATMQFLSSSPRLDAVKEKLDLTDIPEESLTAEHAQSVAAEVAAYTLNLSKSGCDGKRSRSITTQDFLDEAMHIMSLIRARGRPHSGLGNVEESDAEEAYGQHLRPGDVATRSPSPLRLSRPPSREGGSTGWRPRSQMQQDSRVASQLRRFQESDDELDLGESSLHSLRVDESETPAGPTVATNSLSNVRITGPQSNISRARGGSVVSNKSKGSPTKTHGSNPSLDSSSSRTVGTHSTRKSENVATLAPETVAHLIPEEVGGMTFDKDKQKWVRIKASKSLSSETPVSPDPPSNITSDDDPFNDIPDLTVDEMKELTRIGLSPTKESSFLGQGLASSAHQDTRVNSNDTVIARPVTRGDQAPPPFTSSSAPSKYSSAFGSSKQFSSSQPQVETRATSWCNEELANLKHSRMQSAPGYLDLTHLNMPHPISDIPEHLEEDEQYDEESRSFDDSLTEDITEELPAPKQRQQRDWFQSSPGSMYAGGARQVSLRRQTLHRGLHANAQDQSEMSFIATLPDKRLMSVSVNLSRPSGGRGNTSQDLVVPSSSPARVDATFYLSDLPDFTVNGEDEERPSEKVLAKRVAQHDASDRYNMAVQTLVKTLTDVEPDEPYWEDIKQLSLRERDLGSIHDLDHFCTRLEDLDLSNNNIAHLEGAPHSIRRLNVRSNALSSLTAWSHLMNLQYLDISKNAIDNLAGLSMLVHLREVRADDNQISSLDGIMGLDGLLKLSVRRNNLASVDLEGCELKRLEDLDLSGNQLTEFTFAESLPSLSRLILDENQLTTFSTMECVSKLACLSVQKNRIESLDVSNATALRYLNVDDNRLSNIQGLERLLHLETLSMRKQKASSLSIFKQPLHVRSLYLSSNSIASLRLPHSYHSVQTLELACCGLQELPMDFGLKFPNLRSVNLWFNALKDIRPLLNIPRLQTLNVSNNRVSRLRKTTATLATMQYLRRFDARDNPITLGFYPPTTTAACLTAMNEQSLVPSCGPPEDTDLETETQVQQRAARSYSLPTADRTADAEHWGRLDDDAKLMRRVYELLLAQSCSTLEKVDGLSFQRAKVVVKDKIWDRLIDLGVMRRAPSSDENGMRVVTPLCELGV